MLDRKTLAVLKIRAKLLHAARSWFDQNGYIEVQGPTIIPAVGDWMGYFEVKYFDKKAYLTQGLQPYANVFVSCLGKVYTIAPAFRAEKFASRRHLAEYWRIEVAQTCDLESIIKVQEGFVAHICNSLSKSAKEELTQLKYDVDALANVPKSFPKLTYEKVIQILEEDGFDVHWGQQIDPELENHLSQKNNSPFFITKFPTSIQTFFYESPPETPELTLSADLLAPEGYGEIGGGGQIVFDKKVLIQKMTEERIEPNGQEWYLSLIPNNSFPRSGFVIGLDRLVQWICKLGNVKQATAFPRAIDDSYP
jgi:asparaginyl-tRNA synthetase